MHAGIETNASRGQCGFAPGRKPNSVRVGREKPPANDASATRNEKASAAAEVTPLSQNPFLNGGFLVRRQHACSYTVENLDSPQNDDDGQYQRSRRQYTF